MKRYGLLKGALKRIYPCKTCSAPLKNDNSGPPTKEQPCGHNYSKELSDNCYTLLLPIDEQVKFFLRHHRKRKPTLLALVTKTKRAMFLLVIVRNSM